MGLSRSDSISQYGTEAYTGWGSTEAAADARAKGISGGGSSYSNQYSQAYMTDLGAFNKSVDDYTNEIIAQAGGDYNFAAKWIENNYAELMGTDQVEKAAFLKKVANALEQKIGTIAFDYETNTYRTISDRDLALKRLDEDEASFKRTSQQEREAQQGNLNARGLVSAPRDAAQGLYGKEVGSFEAGVQDRMSALERARENVNIGSERQLADITTSARRGADTATDTQQYQIEQAKRQKEKTETLARAQASASKSANESYLKNFYFGNG